MKEKAMAGRRNTREGIAGKQEVNGKQGKVLSWVKGKETNTEGEGEKRGKCTGVVCKNNKSPYY